MSRQIKRFLFCAWIALPSRLREHGPAGLISGHREKPSNNRLDATTADRAVAIIREFYEAKPDI